MDLPTITARSNYTYKVHTFGCKVNTYDSGLLQSRLERGGASHAERPQVHILNTCAVTATATQEAVRQIRRLKSRNPLSTIVVTGCAAQVDTDQFSDLPGVDLVVANSHKGQLAELLDRYFAGTLENKVFKANIFRKEDLEGGGGLERAHSRAFVKIQDGCNSFCSYCVIPFGRGKSRSLPVEQLVSRIRQLDREGYAEVVLTGVHIGDYRERRPDREWSLEDLIEEILLKTAMPRLRLTSLEPPELSEKILRLYENPRMCRHFHMSVQSACSETLRRMQRQYLAEDVARSLWALEKRVPGSFVGMDVIVGFPGETEEDFKETYQRLEDLPWTRLHVFPYSERPGTKAVNLAGKISGSEIKNRARQLRELSSRRYGRAARAQVGEMKSLLALQRSSHQPQLGLTRDYWSVQLDREVRSGREYRVEITGYDPLSSARLDGPLSGRVLN